MFVKICGITNEDDALLAVAFGADAVGFVFAPSVRQISVKHAYDIARRLPPEILTVGVFRDAAPDWVVQQLRDAGLKAAQLHGHETPEVTQDGAAPGRLRDPGLPGRLAGARAGRRPRRRRHPGRLGHARLGHRVRLVARRPGARSTPRSCWPAGLTPDNVATAIARVKPWGVDVSSGVEREPGRKDPVKLKEFIEAARAAAPIPYRGPDEMPYDWADE